MSKTQIIIDSLTLDYEIIYNIDKTCSHCSHELFFPYLQTTNDISPHVIIKNTCGHSFHMSCAKKNGMICNIDKKSITNHVKNQIKIGI